MRPRSFITAALLTSLIALTAWVGPRALWWATHKRVYFWGEDLKSGQLTAGWYTISRISGHADGPQRSWYVDQGTLASEGVIERRKWARLTLWAPAGEIDSQVSGSSVVNEPPWSWSAVPQTVPNAPWHSSDVSAHVWYERWAGQ